jgi:transcription elongation GreA/GreB family factor
MELEIEKAVGSGKLTAQAGAALNALKPGTYCLHKSWGFGQIDSINFLLNQITINFKSKKGHAMQLEYAAESLQALSADHIFSKKAGNLGAIKAMTKSDPIGLCRLILNSFGGRATQDQIAQSLIGDVFNEAEFKRWWDSTKKVLKKDGHFGIPSKKSEAIELREAPVARGDELLANFAAARRLDDQQNALEQIGKNLDVFPDAPNQLRDAIDATGEIARKSQRLQTAEAFELLICRDEICEKANIPISEGAFTLGQLIRDEERRLSDILQNIALAKHKRLLSEFPKAFGEEWSRKALELILRSNNIRTVSEIAALLQENGKTEELRSGLDRWIRDHSITAELLYWLCKSREGEFADLVTTQIFSAILSALERDQFSEVRRGGKLHDLVMDDRELLPELLAGGETEMVRDAVRKLLMTPVFEELNKRSLLGRIIRCYPEMESLLTGETTEKQESLIVSWASLEKRKNEYETLTNKTIPENIREISVAREHGDLRENFEYKAAKDMQRVLMRRKSEAEHQLSHARGTNFENPDTTIVSIGTVVTVRSVETGTSSVFTILGAWDSEPEKHIISYLTAIGQALLGRRVGEQIDLPAEFGTEKMEIVTIEAWKNPAE